MHRLTVFVLTGLLMAAVLLSALGFMPFSPLRILGSAVFLLVLSRITGDIFAAIYKTAANAESAYITGLILSLIISPATVPADFLFLGLTALSATASKYILAINKRHLLNPAAVGIIISAYGLGRPASWWVGSGVMTPFVLAAGLLIVRKTKLAGLEAAFFVSAGLSAVLFAVNGGHGIIAVIKQLIFFSPLIFFGTIMLTEPRTLPPAAKMKKLTGVLTGLLFLPQFRLHGFYFTPETALIVGNLFSYFAGPRPDIILILRKKIQIAPDVVDFIFQPSGRFFYEPGQFIEWTLAHSGPDSRGSRRFFTLASSPTEDAIRIGVKFYLKGSSYKKAIASLGKGSKIVVSRVMGEFTMPKDPRIKLVFIAGGIGITPFRSMLKYLIDTKGKRNMVLIYTNKKSEEIVYQEILLKAQKETGLKIIYCLTEEKGDLGADKIFGRIDEQMIRQEIPDYHERFFYLSGPVRLVFGCEKILKNLGLNAGQIKKDYFPGLP